MLRGDRIVLREWRESDLASLATLRNDPDLQSRLMSRPKPNSIDSVRAWLNDRSMRSNMVFFVIADGADAALGYLQIAEVDSTNGHGELGICLAPDVQGRGIASQAFDLLEPYAKEILGLRKLVLKVLLNNTRAISFYRKSGYRDVGTLHGHFRIGDRYEDVLLMERQLSA